MCGGRAHPASAAPPVRLKTRGLFANAFIEATNRAYGTSVAPMSDQEILLTAEVASGVDIPFDDTVSTFYDVSGFVTLVP